MMIRKPKNMSKRVGRQTEGDKTSLPARTASCAVLTWTAECSNRAAEFAKAHILVGRLDRMGTAQERYGPGWGLVGRVESLDGCRCRV
jgi:hypothetical protein